MRESRTAQDRVRTPRASERPPVRPPDRAGLGRPRGALAAAALVAVGLGAPTLAAPTLAAPTLVRTPVADGWRTALDAAQERAVQRLDEFVDWCTERKMFATRDRAFEAILRFDPDNFRAHKGLKHTQDRDGTWHPPERPTKSEDYRGSADEAAERRASIVDEYAEAVLGLFDLDGRPPGPEEEQALRTVLWVQPDHAEARDLVGETRDGERWVLDETAAARERRAFLDELQRSSLEEAAAALDPGDVGASEASLGVEWGHVVATPAVRVLGTGERKVTEQAAQASHSVGPFFRAVFGTETRPFDGATVFLLATEDERDAFLDSHPGVPADRRDGYRRLSGIGIPETPDIAMWHAHERRRLDAVSRNTFGAFLMREFGLSPRVGWAFEGVGMYLNRRLVATQSTWYSAAPGSADAQELRTRLLDPSVNWMDEAIAILAGGYDLQSLLSKSTTEMDARDMVVSYAFGAYLVEGHPELAAVVLQRIGSGAEPTDAVLEDVLGRSLDSIRERFARWLEERRQS